MLKENARMSYLTLCMKYMTNNCMEYTIIAFSTATLASHLYDTNVTVKSIICINLDHKLSMYQI